MGDKRQYIVSHETWYAPSTASGEIPQAIVFGLFCEDGSTSGTAKIEWEELGTETVPRLFCYDDGWAALISFSDVLEKMGERDDENISPGEFSSILEGCGFEDRTERVSPIVVEKEIFVNMRMPADTAIRLMDAIGARSLPSLRDGDADVIRNAIIAFGDNS